MSFISSVKDFVIGQKDNVELLVKFAYCDGTSRENRLVVRRDQIQEKCDAWAALTGVQEVMVYQRIFHDVRITDDIGPNASIGLGAGLLALMKV